MIDRLLANPLIAFGFLILVFFLVLIYMTQRERAKVARMRGPRGFQPRWSSGRKHRRRRGHSRKGEFKPQWNRNRSRTRKAARSPKNEESKQDE